LSGGFTYFETAAGKGVSGAGATIEEAFAQAALGVFALAVDPASIEERESRVIRAHGVDPTRLLVNWLNECLYVLEVEGFLARRIEFISSALDNAAPGGEPMRLQCLLHGEEADPARHVARESLRAVSADGAAVMGAGGGFEARVIAR
jgi:SHS2 domain-containing protein